MRSPSSASTPAPKLRNSCKGLLGALSELPTALTFKVLWLCWAGEVSAAAALSQEVQAAVEATGSSIGPYAALLVAGLRGRPDEVSGLIDAARSALSQRGEQFR